MELFDVFVKDPTAAHPGGWVLVKSVEAKDETDALTTFRASGLAVHWLEYRARTRALDLAPVINRN